MSQSSDAGSFPGPPVDAIYYSRIKFPGRVPTAVALALAQLLESVSAGAPGLLNGFYLIGSIALGAYQQGRSDVDVVAVLRREADRAERACLQHAHRQIARAYPFCQMDGGYWRLQDLRDEPQRAVECLSYHNGKFQASRSSLSPVDRWLLERHGVAVCGPRPQDLGLAVDWPAVTRYMSANLSTYWRSFTRTPRRLAWLLSDTGIEWAVLGISRQWYAFYERDIPHKLQAGQYVLERVPDRWQHILKEALALRAGNLSRYRSRLKRASDAVKFLNYAIGELKK